MANTSTSRKSSAEPAVAIMRQILLACKKYAAGDLSAIQGSLDGGILGTQVLELKSPLGAREIVYQKSMLKQLEEMFENFENYAYEYNVITDSAEHQIVCKKRADQTFKGRLATKAWSMLFLGLPDKIELYALPSEKVKAFAESSDGFLPYMVLIPTSTLGRVTWWRNGVAISENGVDYLSQQLFGTLVRLSKGELTEEGLAAEEFPAPPPATPAAEFHEPPSSAARQEVAFPEPPKEDFPAPPAAASEIAPPPQESHEPPPLETRHDIPSSSTVDISGRLKEAAEQAARTLTPPPLHQAPQSTPEQQEAMLRARADVPPPPGFSGPPPSSSMNYSPPAPLTPVEEAAPEEPERMFEPEPEPQPEPAPEPISEPPPSPLPAESASATAPSQPAVSESPGPTKSGARSLFDSQADKTLVMPPSSQAASPTPASSLPPKSAGEGKQKFTTEFKSMVGATESNVALACEVLLQSLDKELENLTRLGSEAFASQDVARAQRALKRVAKLKAFRERASALFTDWRAESDD